MKTATRTMRLRVSHRLSRQTTPLGELGHGRHKHAHRLALAPTCSDPFSLSFGGLRERARRRCRPLPATAAYRPPRSRARCPLESGRGLRASEGWRRGRDAHAHAAPSRAASPGPHALRRPSARRASNARGGAKFESKRLDGLRSNFDTLARVVRVRRDRGARVRCADPLREEDVPHHRILCHIIPFTCAVGPTASLAARSRLPPRLSQQPLVMAGGGVRFAGGYSRFVVWVVIPGSKSATGFYHAVGCCPAPRRRAVSAASACVRR